MSLLGFSHFLAHRFVVPIYAPFCPLLSSDDRSPRCWCFPSVFWFQYSVLRNERPTRASEQNCNLSVWNGLIDFDPIIGNDCEICRPTSFDCRALKPVPQRIHEHMVVG